MTDRDQPPLKPEDAERRFAAMLEEAGLPRFDSAHHDAEVNSLEVCWDNGLTIHIDLERGDLEPLDEWERRAILGGTLCVGEPIHVTVPGSPEDPRAVKPPPGVVVHYVPELHPDDVTTIDGIPATSPSRTLIDLAECVTKEELRDAFARADALGLLDPEALRASRARVEWRPSLAMLDEVIAEFCD
jgi:hypothetical protein